MGFIFVRVGSYVLITRHDPPREDVLDNRVAQDAVGDRYKNGHPGFRQRG